MEVGLKVMQMKELSVDATIRKQKLERWISSINCLKLKGKKLFNYLNA